MDAILHTVDIGAPAEKVYDAVSTGAGLSNWWTRQVDADERVGGLVKFKFLPDFNPEMEVTEMTRPTAVAWRCVGGAAPWKDAVIRFDIEPRGERTMLMFRQRYAADLPDEPYGTFNYNWGFFMYSLQQYVEKGAGMPHKAG